MKRLAVQRVKICISKTQISREESELGSNSNATQKSFRYKKILFLADGALPESDWLIKACGVLRAIMNLSGGNWKVWTTECQIRKLILEMGQSLSNYASERKKACSKE